MYLSNFPQTLYAVSPPSYRQQPKFVLLTDIIRNVRFKREVIDKITAYDNYVMPASDTIEIVSERLYGSPYYHWVLMLLNDRYDYRKDMPIAQDVFDSYIISKYGSIEIAKTLLIDIRDTRQVSQSVEIGIARSIYKNDAQLGIQTVMFVDKNTGLQLPSNSVELSGYNPVYAYGYEVLLNEEKRKIKIISKDVLDLVLSNFSDLL